MREDLAGLIWKAPSTGVICFLAESGKLVLTELGAMKEAETWSIGIFFQCVKTWLVHFWMTPSIGVVICLVAKTGKWVLTEPGAM